MQANEGEESLVAFKCGNFVSTVDVTLHLAHDIVKLCNLHIAVRESNWAQRFNCHPLIHDLVEDSLNVVLLEGDFLGGLESSLIIQSS